MSSYTWNGSTDTSWTTTANWTPSEAWMNNSYPSQDYADVIINKSATIDLGNGTYTTNIGTFTVNNDANVEISGPGSVTPSQGVIIDSGSTITLNGATFTSSGSGTDIKGTLQIEGGANVTLEHITSATGTITFGPVPDNGKNVLNLSINQTFPNITNFSSADTLNLVGLTGGSNITSVRWVQSAVGSHTYALQYQFGGGEDWRTAVTSISFAQQLDSNGKPVTENGQPVYYTPADLNSSATGTVVQDENGIYTYTNSAANIDNKNGAINITCFLSGSMIRTTKGDVAVENMQIGDEVVAYDWQNNKDITRSVIWVGKAHATVRPELTDDEAGWPVRILKDAIADGVPYKDMLITAEHCLFFEGKLVPVRMLVNGVSIFYDKSITSYDYYHVETEQHSVITADGMLTESYLDTGNRSAFQQKGKVVRIGGTVKTWANDAGAPLEVARAFVEPLFHALEGRTNNVVDLQIPTTVETTTDPDLHLLTNTGAVVRPMRKSAQHYSFMLPPNTTSVHIVSRASRPSDVIGPFVDDRRYMGVAVADVRLLCAKQSHDITAHLQAEKPEGWYASANTTPHAWTNGNAMLPLGDHLTEGKMGILSMTIRAAGPYVMEDQKAAETKVRSA